MTNKQLLNQQLDELSRERSVILKELGSPTKATKDSRWRLSIAAEDAIKEALDIVPWDFSGDLTMRKIRPHKGGRTSRKDIRLTKSTANKLAYLRRFHGLTLGDLVAEAVAKKFERVIEEESHEKRRV